jgi:hypothetical protein
LRQGDYPFDTRLRKAGDVQRKPQERNYGKETAFHWFEDFSRDRFPVVEGPPAPFCNRESPSQESIERDCSLADFGLDCVAIPNRRKRQKSLGKSKAIVDLQPGIKQGNEK